MRIRLYADEDSMEKNLIRALRTRGVDVLTPVEARMVEREDEQHLDFAAAHGRVLLTCNIKDFFRLHKEYLSAGESHAGILLVRQKEYSVGEQTRRILRIIAVRSAEEMQNNIEFLSAWGER